MLQHLLGKSSLYAVHIHCSIWLQRKVFCFDKNIERCLKRINSKYGKCMDVWSLPFYLKSIGSSNCMVISTTHRVKELLCIILCYIMIHFYFTYIYVIHWVFMGISSYFLYMCCTYLMNAVSFSLHSVSISTTFLSWS